MKLPPFLTVRPSLNSSLPVNWVIRPGPFLSGLAYSGWSCAAGSVTTGLSLLLLSSIPVGSQ